MSPQWRPRVIRAAGGVLWRDITGRVEIALVHRPKYDDWSLPKGKLKRGEHVLDAARREVCEETGHSIVVGRPLGQTIYPMGLALKRVRYWAMQATGGAFAPSREVDALDWMPVPVALERLDHRREKRILTAFTTGPAPTRAWMLVRHACAGDRESWSGDDRDRPLDVHGQAQAGALTTIMAAYGIRRLISADVQRCLDTIGPYARYAGLAVETEPLFSEAGHAAAPEAARRQLIGTVRDPRPSAICSQGGAIPELLAGIGAAHHVAIPNALQLNKGAYCVLHLDAESSPERVVGIECDQPLR